MSNLIEYAQRHVESLVKDLTGNDDFMPFMTIQGRDDPGIVYAGLMMPGDSDGKDSIADTMMAICAAHRAVEAVFVTVSWMVMRNKDDEDFDDLPGRLSEHPDRVEAVFIAQRNADGAGSTHSAPVIRENGTVRIGEWTAMEGAGISGRFGDAIHNGMDFGKRLPPEMCEYIDAEMQAGRGEEIVRAIVRQLNVVRTGAFKN
jgi:hypothetical protein